MIDSTGRWRTPTKRTLRCPDATAAQPIVAKWSSGSTGASAAAASSASSSTGSSSAAGASSSQLARRRRAARCASAGAAGEGGGSAGQRKAVEPAPEDDDEVMEQAAPANPVSTSAGGRRRRRTSSQCTGHKGAIALADFPHARENCVSKPFRFGAEQQHCANCYCYVCDDLASKCPQWDSHCAATHTKQVWQQARQAWKTRGAAAPAASSSSAPAAAPVARYNPHSRNQTPLSVDAVLERCTQVYPVEVAEPAGLLPSVQLRPYQKQSLAFMIDIEKSTDVTLLGSTRTGGSAAASSATRWGWARRWSA